MVECLRNNDRNCRENRFDKYYGFLIITHGRVKSNFFTFKSGYVTMYKIIVSVAQWIERRPPEAGAQVRLLSETLKRSL